MPAAADAVAARPRPSLRPAPLALLAVLTALLVLTGCTAAASDPGSNLIGDDTPDRALQRAREAAAAAESVHLAGTVVSADREYELDMRLGADGAIGRITTDGRTFELLRVGEDLYLKGGEDFYAGPRESSEGATPSPSGSASGQAQDAGGDGEEQQDGGAEGEESEESGDGDEEEAEADPTAAASASALELLGQKYLKVPAGDPVYQQFSVFTDKDALLADLFVLNGALTQDGDAVLDGTRVLRLVADGGAGGAIEIAMDGEPYPLRYQRAAGTGELLLSEFGEPVEVAAPEQEQVVDYGDELEPSATESAGTEE
ncbi:hypothetical protein [Allostreptomyces psammosilenae]|uniref:Lipoprotein n=1 Tax=Allostreptomyces psammosilenae TaxID=1892865 RepID=A0A853ABZ5_9ACTN|nr:hypothetical protein [Allostreptomyces psammosilenae]NYI08101.1 hypothetical protein [Allostreptomyces psammosilenae]